MSGIVGIVNVDGRPVERELLTRIIGLLEFRGPDATSVWVEGSVGFGHTLLRTTDESAHEHQPFSFDESTWIVADARVDARPELVAKLALRGRQTTLARPDVELILHAYCAWGEACVEHLLGDFVFAIWDAQRRRLFCARDHLGIRPMFYAHLGSTVIFSNTLDCVREHPAVSSRLNDLAIADFLLFGLNLEKDTTSFADVRRLPPAHTAVFTAGGCKLRRYWTLPIDEPIYFRRLDDYTEHFSELLRDAVDDRLRTDRVSVYMSGGLDSPTLAAVARERLARRPGHTSLKAFTTVIGTDDDELRYAQLVATHLGIPIQVDDDLARPLDPGWEQNLPHVPEPFANPSAIRDEWLGYGRVARHARVAFYGEGPDNALNYEWKAYVGYLLHRRDFGRLLTDISHHVASHRRIPFLGSLPAILAARAKGESMAAVFPKWVNPDLVARLHLRERFECWHAGGPLIHPFRPRGYRSFALPLWQEMFESFEPGLTRCALEVRHPFLDLRLLRYMLRVPALPWCRAKYLVRMAGRDILPAAVLRRPKSSLADPWADRLRALDLGAVQGEDSLARYIDLRGLPTGALRQSGDTFWQYIHVRSLASWLQDLGGRSSRSIAQEL